MVQPAVDPRRTNPMRARCASVGLYAESFLAIADTPTALSKAAKDPPRTMHRRTLSSEHEGVIERRHFRARVGEHGPLFMHWGYAARNDYCRRQRDLFPGRRSLL